MKKTSLFEGTLSTKTNVWLRPEAASGETLDGNDIL